MGSALRDIELDSGTSASAEELRLQVAERLAAHRSLRGHGPAQRPADGTPSKAKSGTADERAVRIAAVVAERYARSQSYRAYLAAEAERAVQQAQAAAEVAALNAQAMLAAQQELLDSLRRERLEADAAQEELATRGLVTDSTGVLARNQEEETAGRIAQPDSELFEGLSQELTLWPDGEAKSASPAPRSKAPSVRNVSSARARGAIPTAADDGAATTKPQAADSGPVAHGGLRVRLYDEALDAGFASPMRGSQTGFAARPAFRRESIHDAEAQALDEEIAFRQAPVFEEPAGPPMPLPANLIEFPRQLVASRKARPRLAEGPLREEAEAAPGAGQLRIFEVDAGQINTTPVEATEATPQWSSIWLDTPGSSSERGAAGGQIAGELAADGIVMTGRRSLKLPQVASIGRRVAAVAIDGGIVLCGFLAAAGAFVLTSSRLQQQALGHGLRMIAEQASPQPGLFLAAAALAFALLYLLYQALFFRFAEATPGMRCTRIALCTFAEENPARSAMRRRLLAALLSACPLGLGFLWAALDEERLTWHDRVSRMYQRSY